MVGTTRCLGVTRATSSAIHFGTSPSALHGFRFGWGLLAGVAGKLLWEQNMGAMPFSEGVVGGPVVTDAHLWGAIGGLGAGLVYHVWRGRRARL